MPIFRTGRLLLTGLLMLPIIAVAQPTISGLVRNGATNLPVSGADLDVFDSAGNRVDATGDTTNGDGTYTLILPGTGSFIVRVDMPTGSPLADQYYPGTLLRSEAQLINIPTLTTQVTGIDFTLPTGFAITGRVTADGAGLADIDLDLYAGNGEFLGSYPAQTNSDGTFLLGALPNGTYYLKADPDAALSQFHVFRFYGGTQDIASASPISINGSSATGIQIELPPGGTISGLIQAADGTPLADIDLDLYDNLGNRLPYTARSDLDGSYFVGPLPAGNYLLRADPDPLQGYVRAYFGNGNDIDLATPIGVTANQETSGIDFNLIAGGTISGTVLAPNGTPLQGIDIDLFNANNGRVSWTARTDAQGIYLLGALPAGDYLVRADPALTSGYAGVYFGGNAAPSSAQAVAVLPGNDTPNINLQLLRGAWIEGVVRDAGGTPVAGIDLDPYDSAGTRLYPTARSGADGSFAIGPLPASTGGIILRADPEATDGVALQFYPAADSLAGASPISLTQGLATGGIDFSLPFAGWIEGGIQDLGGLPLVGIDLDFFDALGNRLPLDAKSGPDGRYLAGPIAAGQILVRADPLPMQGYAIRYYPDARLQSGAQPVSVQAGTGTEAVDFSLPPAGYIRGYIRTAANLGVGGIDVDLYGAAGNNRIPVNAVSENNGLYTIGPVEPGEYIIRADPAPMDGYARRYFFNSRDAASASVISMTQPVGISSINFTLPPAGWISGTIRDGAGQPVPGIDLDLYEAMSTARIPEAVSSGPDGTYLLGPLELGSYFVRADPRNGQPFVRQYFANVDRIESASPVNVTSSTGNTGIDFNLPPGRSLSGSVLLPDGQPAAGIDMDIIDASSGTRLEQSTFTDLSGAFALPPVPHGSYYLRADPADTSPYLDTYYMRTAFRIAADPVTVSASSVATGFTIELLPYESPVITRSDSQESFLVHDGGGQSLSFTVASPSGSITEMRFYVGSTRIGTDAASPFSLDVADLPFGIYDLIPSVVDIHGRETPGEPVFIIRPEVAPTIGNPLYLGLRDGSGRALLAWQSLNGIDYALQAAPLPGGPWATLQTYPGNGRILVHLQSLPFSGAQYLRIVPQN